MKKVNTKNITKAMTKIKNTVLAFKIDKNNIHLMELIINCLAIISMKAKPNLRKTIARKMINTNNLTLVHRIHMTIKKNLS